MGYIDIKITSDIDILKDIVIDVASVEISNLLGSFGFENSNLNNLSNSIKTNDIQGIKANVSELMAEEILKRAKYYCPVDTGKLVNSGRIERKGDGTCDIVFGNEDCTYALFVHENMSARHATPTCAKFLTIAVQEVEALWR